MPFISSKPTATRQAQTEQMDDAAVAQASFASVSRDFQTLAFQDAGFAQLDGAVGAALLAGSTALSPTTVGPTSLPVTASAAIFPPRIPIGTSVPSWVNALSTASIRADMIAADVRGTVSYSGLKKLIADLDAILKADRTPLTSAELSDLRTIARNLNNGMHTSSYLTTIFNDLVNGNPANATWTGGNRSSSYLGNLAVGSTATQLAELNDKWFLGTDYPSGGPGFSVFYAPSSAPLFGSTGPSMNDINQGAALDCYLLASLAEVAKQNPNIISSMLTSNGNDTYGVRFYVNGVANYVTVDNQLSFQFNDASDLWASLAEKAYAQLQAGGVVTGNPACNFGNSWTTIGNSGQSLYALEEITGASAITQFTGSGSSWEARVYNSSLSLTGYSSGLSTAAIQGTLITDLERGDDLILSSQTDDYSQGRQTLVAHHAMSIYGYDRATGMFEIRNPWGGNSRFYDTTFEVSLSTLLKDGDSINVDNVGTRLIVQSAPVTSNLLTSPLVGADPALLSQYMAATPATADLDHGTTMIADPIPAVAQNYLAPAHV